jgi:CspA family cold shock protein
MAVGKVRWFSGPFGYGFIERDDGRSFYVHYTALREDVPLHSGERVEFEVREGFRGPQATQVNRLQGASSAF